ncbi:MAG: hypothetical protein IKE15_04580 [Clostridia bacterium]|nr:hypothetical protein [Clostridia bacterium]MBR2662405.1 hypothetical protein [Clostridia bacterium]
MLRLLGLITLGNIIFGGRRRHGSFLDGLLTLPALMFGGWIAIVVVGGVLGSIGSIIGGIFSGLSSLTSAAFSGKGLVIGIVIGLVAFYYFRSRNERNADEAETEEN